MRIDRMATEQTDRQTQRQSVGGVDTGSLARWEFGGVYFGFGVGGKAMTSQPLA